MQYKYPLQLKDELIRLWGSKVKDCVARLKISVKHPSLVCDVFCMSMRKYFYTDENAS